MKAPHFKSIRRQMRMSQRSISEFLCRPLKEIRQYEKGEIKIPLIVSKILTHPSFNQYVEK